MLEINDSSHNIHCKELIYKLQSTLHSNVYTTQLIKIVSFTWHVSWSGQVWFKVTLKLKLKSSLRQRPFFSNVKNKVVVVFVLFVLKMFLT